MLKVVKCGKYRQLVVSLVCNSYDVKFEPTSEFLGNLYWMSKITMKHRRPLQKSENSAKQWEVSRLYRSTAKRTYVDDVHAFTVTRRRSSYPMCAHDREFWNLWPTDLIIPANGSLRDVIRGGDLKQFVSWVSSFVLESWRNFQEWFDLAFRVPVKEDVFQIFECWRSDHIVLNFCLAWKVRDEQLLRG